jgi:hypothetical protein
MTISTRAVSLFVSFSLVLLGALSCASFHSREDLDIAMGKHHIDLRWGRLENAAQRVKPEMRAAFLRSWAEKAGQIELQDIDVAGVVVHEGGDTADVIVNMTWIERSTMQVKTGTVTERWLRTDQGWLLEKPAEL